jgi:CBS domain-containing protein
MDAKVTDIMRSNVIFGTNKQTVGHIKGIMEKNKLSFIPIIDSDEYVIGVVSIKDIGNANEDTRVVDKVMVKKVFTIPQYDSAQTAARMMRNNKIHHLIVTHEKKLVGIVSSFDLLKLVEGHRFIMKNQGTKKSKNLSV